MRISEGSTLEYKTSAYERKINKEWDISDILISEEGILAHALLSFLKENYPEKTEDLDVYDLAPMDYKTYRMTNFIVLDGDLEGREWAIGTDEDTYISAKESTEELLDDIGFEGFNQDFIKAHIDRKQLISYLSDWVTDDVYNEPESFLDESDRDLSEIQIIKIGKLRKKIDSINKFIEDNKQYFETEAGKKKYNELTILIEEYEEEIEEEENDPDGDFNEEAIEKEVEMMIRAVKSDPINYALNYEINLMNFIDKDSLISDVVDTDGTGHILNSYDGTIDEFRFMDNWYSTFEIDN